MGFIHLHTHTQYSMLDSTIRVEELVQRAVEDGTGAIAITDHNNMFGAVEFYKAAREAKVKPILGSEVNLVAEDRRDPDVRRSNTIVLLCRDEVGYRNLCYLLSRAHMDTPPRVRIPRIDRGLLAEHAAGLVGLSGSLSGEIPQLLLKGDERGAAELARHYSGLFPGAFFLEVVRSGIREQDKVNAGLVAISEEMGIPLVGATDAHYLRKEDAPAHEILMCIQMGKLQADLDSPARITDDLYLASAEEATTRFSDLPEAVENTQRVADLCELTLELGRSYLPTYPVPDEETSSSYLSRIAGVGLVSRLEEARKAGDEADEQLYRDRLQVELSIIDEMGFSGYFLIVWDFIRYARDNDIPVGPGRGSGAGSLVAYSLNITGIDPIPYGLLFERFLNPERVSMPDFDIDFCMNKRDQVIRYVTQRYGEDCVGQIITYGSMKAKAVVRDVGRVMGLTYGEADRAAKLIPEALDMTLALAFDEEPRLQEFCDEDPRYARLFEVARTLEGLNRQPGMHAAGVVIADRPLWEYVPLYAVHGDDGTVTRVTQFAKDDVEEAGLVKFDFLGLKTLTVIDHAVGLINRAHDVAGEQPLVMADIPLDDPNVYKLITSGNTTGIFQLESSLFRDLMRRLRPDRFEDIIAAVALGRPGPLKSGMVDSYIRRKHGEETVVYPHPWLESILRETNGVMVYQEQVMQAASVLAGFSLGQADLLRRAMGKKKKKEMDAQRESFISGCRAKDIPEERASNIFALMESFAEYGFNKSHSAAYGLIAYQTGWLKTNHPVEFMAALLTCDGDNTDKVVRFISEARSMGITVRPPSVNASALDFAVDGGAIRFGLGAVKGVGAGAVEGVILAREEDGPFTSLFDFCERVDLRRVNRRVLESLTKCGAFDEFQLPRQGIFNALEKAIERGQAAQRDEEVGQFNLFGELETPEEQKQESDLIDLGDEWSDKLRLAFEKECLGFYVSGHPLDAYRGDVQRVGCTPLAEIENCEARTSVVAAAVVSELRERPLRSGAGRMAVVTLEDQTGRMEMLVFSKLYPQVEEILKSDEPILVQGTVQFEGDGENRAVKLRAEGVRTMGDVRRETARRICLKLDPEAAEDADRLQRLQEQLLTNETGLPVDVHVAVPGLGSAMVTLGEHYRLPPDEEAIFRVERIIGRGRVAVR